MLRLEGSFDTDGLLMQPKIRTATFEDAPLIASLIRRGFLKQAQILGLDEVEYPNYVAFDTEKAVRHRLTADVHIALAYLDLKSEPVATISCLLRSDPILTAEITRLAVLPSYRGNNYGQALMTYAENRMLTAGAKVAELSIVASFQRPKWFYERLGYAPGQRRQIATLPFEVLFMSKRLSPQP